MPEPSRSVFRTTLAGLGGLGGLAFWALTDPLRDIALSHPVILFLWALTGGFFVSVLTAMGPLPARLALKAGLIVAIPVAGLLALASLRFSSLSAAIEDGQLVAGTLLLIGLALPFVICWLRDRIWNDYDALFDTSWRLVVHFTAAWIFTGLCWAVMALSAVLLDLVGITILEDLIDEEIFVMVFTGVVLGLGLAVIFELSDYISPYLVLSLLRLLLIPLSVIVTIFLLALPFRGLSELFNTLSPAFVMMATAIGLICLISVAVERDDEDAVNGSIMQAACRYAAFLLLLLAGLAVYAVFVRVMDYGWTPARFAAVFIALVTFAYGLAYSFSVLLGPDWMARVRRANVYLALGVMSAIALCMTPLVNPQAISVASQMSRFEADRMPAQALPFYELRDAWGKPGARAYAELAQSEDEAVRAALAATRPEDADLSPEDRRRLSLQAVRDSAVLRPETMTFPEAALGQLTDWELNQVRRGCSTLPDQEGPGCVILEGDFLGNEPGMEYAVIVRTEGNRAVFFWLSNSRVILRDHVTVGQTADQLISDVLENGFGVVPAEVNSLTIGGRVFNPFN